MSENATLDRIENRLTRVENRLTEIETQSAVDEIHRQTVEKRLGSIEDTLKWLVRLIIGALILAIIGFITQGGLTVVT